MKVTALAAALAMFTVSPCSGLEPIPIVGGGGGGDAPYETDPSQVVCWSQPPNLEGYVVTSEIIDRFGLESQTANDFVLSQDAVLTRIRWWGIYYQYIEGDPIGFPINLMLYREGADCRPEDEPVWTVPCVVGHETFIYDNHGWPLFEYWEDVATPVLLAGVTYWFVAQSCDHVFPPQWGRAQATEIVGCESVMRSAYFGFPDWTPLSEMEGWPEAWDVSQELECDSEPTAVVPSAWGAIKGLYR